MNAQSNIRLSADCEIATLAEHCEALAGMAQHIIDDGDMCDRRILLEDLADKFGRIKELNKIRTADQGGQA